jgi:2',3'-cyclic-nucleotide 2'-phosphodiesterase
MSPAKALLLGDVIGLSGILALKKRLPSLKAELGADLVLANGENAAAGFGLTTETAEEIFSAGVDVITSGNHIWQKRDFWPVLEKDARVLRPANYPPGVPGHGLWVGELSGFSWAVLNLQGREHMYPVDCPFRAADAAIQGLGLGRILIIDFHAESAEEKEALALYLDGRIGCVAGTHTHIQTADERVLPKGTAYITDLGMVGPEDSVIGMKTEICVRRSLTQVPLKMEVAEGPATICGLVVEFEAETGRAKQVTRVTIPPSA